jgi:hypothetical protein
MRQLRLLIFSIATICVFALAAIALVNRPPVNDPDDELIIKGGSLEIQCGKNHGKKCLGSNDNQGKYKNQETSKHILKVVVMPINGNDNSEIWSQTFDNTNQPQIKIVYCEPGSTPGFCKGSDKSY